MSEALADAPPTLIVIGAEEDEAELVGAGAASAGAGLGYELAGGMGDVGSAGARVGVGAAMFDSSAPAGASVSPSRPALRGAARPKRKEKSAIGEILKVLIGGVVGLSLGLIALWWIFGKDPLELGPKVSPYAPWIVPAQFAGKPKTAQNSAAVQDTTQPTSQSTSTAKNSQKRALPPKSKKKKPAEPELQATLEGDPLGTQEPPSPAGLDIPLTEPAIPSGGDPLSIDLPSLPETPSLDSKAEPKMTPKTEPKTEPTTTNPAPAPEPAPPTTEVSIPSAEDFQKAAAASAASLTKINESTSESREARQQLFTDMYLAAANMGRGISYLSPSDADLTEPVAAMKAFLSELAGQPGKMNAIKFLASQQFPTRKHDEGIFVGGVVKDFKAAGSMFELTLDGGKGLETLPVVSYNNPQDFCAVGDELLAVGRIIENPQKNLQGYAGEHPRVVLLGYQVVAPKATPPAP